MSLQLWSDLPFVAGATYLAEVSDPLQGTAFSYDIEYNDGLTIVSPWSAGWLAFAKLRRVIVYTDELGRVTDWRIASISDGRSRGDESVVVVCAPVVQDLASVGFLAVVDGLHTTFNLGAELSTDEQYVSGFIIARLTDLGHVHYDAGTFDFTARRNVAWDRWTPLQLWKTLADMAGGEIDLERDALNELYKLGIVAARGSSLPMLRMRTDREILTIQRQRTDENLATAILAVGAVPDGGVDPAGIAFAAWLVTAKTGDTLTLEDPNGGDDPIAFNDQLNPYAVRRPAGTFTDVVDTILATQQVEVADATGIAVGDFIEFRENTSGKHLTMLTNPAAVTEYGLVVGTVEDGEARGERNYTPNPFGADWAGTQYADYGLADGSQTSTTINLKALKPGLIVAAGDRLQSRVNNLSNFPTVQTGGTVSGGGTVSLVFTASVTVTGDELIWLHSGFTEPDGWNATISGGVLLYHRVDTTNDVALSGLVNGTTTNEGGFIADGLTAGAVIEPGDIITVTGSVIGVVRGPVVVDGSGNARIPMGRLLSVTDNTAFVVNRPVWPAEVGPYAMWLAPTLGSNSVDSPDVVITVDGSTPTVHCSVGFTIFSPSTDNTTSSQPIKPLLEVYDVGGAAVLETVPDEDDSFVPLDQFDGTLRASVTLTADKTLRLRFYPVRMSSDSFGSNTTIDPHTYLRWFSLFVGSDAMAPVINGSHANRLWALTNVKLLELSTEPFTLTATAAELARSNPDFAAESVSIGQTVEITAFDMAAAETLVLEVRVVGIKGWYGRPLETEFTFASIPPRIARLLSQVRTKKLYVTIGGELGIATDKAPVAQDGALRARVPPGQTNTDPGTVLPPIEPYELEGPV